MTSRTLMLAAAGAAALSLSACNRPAEKPAVDEAAMDAESTTATGDMASGSTESSAATSGASGASSGGSGSTSTGGTAGSTSGTSGSVAVTGQVDSSIPADAPSRNTRETQAAAGTQTGQVMPYAYSPTNPQLDKKN